MADAFLYLFLPCSAPFGPTDNEEQPETSLALAEVTEKALSIKNQNNDAVLYQGGAKSAIDYLKARSYRGLTGEYEGPAPDSVLTGRTGRAAGYNNEKKEITQWMNDIPWVRKNIYIYIWLVCPLWAIDGEAILYFRKYCQMSQFCWAMNYVFLFFFFYDGRETPQPLLLLGNCVSSNCYMFRTMLYISCQHTVQYSIFANLQFGSSVPRWL